MGTVSNTGSVVGGVSPTSQYVTFTVPSGYIFSSLTLESFDSTDRRGFIGLMPGNQWTTAPASGALPGALAYNHFGVMGVCALNYVSLAPSGVQNCVTDPADQSDLLSKTLGPALSGPLQAGDYTLWIQQTAAAPVSDAFKASFTAVPAPAPLLGLGAARGPAQR